MDVWVPHDMGPGVRAAIVAREKAHAEDLQRAGKWPHLWRIVGEYSNISISDVDSTDELHTLILGLPLSPSRMSQSPRGPRTP